MEENTESKSSEKPAEKQIGRNEPCTCGSGKKYKRCHGVDAAPKMNLPKLDWSKPEGQAGANPLAGMAGNPMVPPGFDPSSIDPQWVSQFQTALQRLPRGQMQRLQSLMQKAMSGRDITREAQDFERTLPKEFQSLMQNFKLPGMDVTLSEAADTEGKGTLALPEGEMTEEQARAIVAQAAASGKISEDQAHGLLDAPSIEVGASESGDKKPFWKKLTGKK